MKKKYLSLTIHQKGLLLVAIPLVSQAVFIALLLRVEAEASAARRWAVHTKEVIAKVEEGYRGLLEGYAGIENPIAKNDSAAPGRLHGAVLDVPVLLGELRGLVADNPAQSARIDELGRQTGRFLEMLRSRQRQSKPAGRVTATGELDGEAGVLGEIRTTIDAILVEETALDGLRMERLGRSASWQFWFLMAGGVAMLAMTLVLTLALLHGAIRRLNVLRDNARRLAAGMPLAGLLSGHDEIALVDRTFHDLAASLREQRQENEMFVYSVSHDLRSPLINLQGFSQELQLAYRDIDALFDRDGVPAEIGRAGHGLMRESVQDSIRYIQTAVGRVARIIDALLRLSRAGRVEYQWQMIDIASIVQRVVDALQSTIAAKKAEVIVRELLPAWGDPTAVEQVFANLIANAVSYLDPARQGQIEVGTAGAASADAPVIIPITSRTTGWASPPRTTRAFSRHLPGSRPTSPKGKASDWLWSIAWWNGWAARSGWSPKSVSVQCFSWLWQRVRCGQLPWRRRSKERARSPTRRSHALAVEPLLIVLVEDDDGHATLVERNLVRIGVSNQIVRLRDGQEALDYLAGQSGKSQGYVNQPILLLLDIKMPRVDGVEVLRQLKSDPETSMIPVIVLTTTDDPREVQRCYELGCSVYITKPVDYQAFVEAINRLGLFLQVVRMPEYNHTPC
jgi:signal transduction histidine kinase/CheY-like chemotaxis protein